MKNKITKEEGSKKKKTICHLHWEKNKTTKEVEKQDDQNIEKGGAKKKKQTKTTYLSEKKSIVDSKENFASKFVAQLKVLKEHTNQISRALRTGQISLF